MRKLAGVIAVLFVLGVMNAKTDKVRQKHYADLLKIAHKTVSYVRGALSLLEQYQILIQKNGLINRQLTTLSPIIQVVGFITMFIFATPLALL